MPKTDPAADLMDGDSNDQAIDRALRQALEPDVATVDRVIHAARSAAPSSSRRPWRLATAWAAAVGAVSLVWWASVEIPGNRISSPGLQPESSAVLRISNEDGLVTVTTPVGSKMIILPGETR